MKRAKCRSGSYEGFPPNMLVRQGWKRDVTLKIGDAVTLFVRPPQ
jgi:hypothetical protein